MCLAQVGDRSILDTTLEPVNQGNKDLRDAAPRRYDSTAPHLYHFFPTTTSDEDIALGQSTLHSLDPQRYQKTKIVILDRPLSSNLTTGLSTIPHSDSILVKIEQPLFPDFSPRPVSEPFSVSRETIKENPEPFIIGIFPSQSQSHYRDLLRREVIPSRWWSENTLEPNGLLMQFVRRLNNRLFECSSCGKKLRRVDRAVDHFREHLKHRPFRCIGQMGCGDSTVALRSILAIVSSLIAQSTKRHATGAAPGLRRKTCRDIKPPESAVDKPGKRLSVD
ncbi:hypothetical protein FRC18_000004 [Serendipita sp. 400]|nr:hypothetical protein FRC18_000004 [Serendipita sp. 400]